MRKPQARAAQDWEKNFYTMRKFLTKHSQALLITVLFIPEIILILWCIDALNVTT